MTLLEAYQNTHYTTDIGITLLVGTPAPELDKLLTKRGANGAAYITAWNPLSEELSLQQNRVRNQQLLADLHHTIEPNNIIAGIGKDPTGVWAGEESFLVVGISEDHIHQLALKYGQNAYVYYQLGKNADLITTSLFCDQK
jgi:hypothetical protein